MALGVASPVVRAGHRLDIAGHRTPAAVSSRRSSELDADVNSQQVYRFSPGPAQAPITDISTLLPCSQRKRKFKARPAAASLHAAACPAAQQASTVRTSAARPDDDRRSASRRGGCCCRRHQMSPMRSMHDELMMIGRRRGRDR